MGFTFLDLQIFRTSSGNFSFSVYRKPTHTGNYLKFQSNHPKCHKRAVVKSLTDRAKKLCSADNLEGEMKMIESTLKQNGYPRHFIQNSSIQTNSQR